VVVVVVVVVVVLVVVVVVGIVVVEVVPPPHIFILHILVAKNTENRLAGNGALHCCLVRLFTQSMYVILPSIGLTTK
ncbi:MAG: hypothetical protein EB117_18040, partial [Betaproteobacteria bacterium]|nr:hypothetical protein [Betaproteobacteria bacterium]